MKEKGDLRQCISKTRHHVSEANIKMAMFVARQQEGDEIITYRFRLVGDNLLEAERKILEIRKAAESGDCAAVLKALNAKDLEFGHNWPDTPKKDE